MRPPDLKAHAEAWLIPINPQHPRYQKEHSSGFVNWLVHCAWSHPFWRWSAIVGAPLRPLTGFGPPKKHFPEATHEVDIASLDPEVSFDPDKLFTGEQDYKFLTPFDLTHQVTLADDQQFTSLVQQVVLAIVEGRMSPDVDYRQAWVKAIDATAQHIREGRHKAQ